jgi:ELWxxDGT repeat protein
MGFIESFRRRRRAACEALESRVLLSTAALVKDIDPGTASGFLPADDTQFVALGNKLIFAGDDGVNGTEPWVSDGTDTGTMMLANINPNGDSTPDEFVLGNGVVYFTAYNGTSTQIWQTDGTSANTIQLTNVPSQPDARGAIFTLYTGGNIYFTESGDNQTDSVWVCNGTVGNQTELTNFSEEQFSDPEFLDGINGSAFFTEGQGNLWVSNGTPGGTTQINAAGFNSDPEIEDGTVYNGKLYFFAYGADNNFGLWSSDGTVDGTNQVGSTTIASGGTSPDFTVSGNALYFIGATNTSGNQIFSTNGSTISQVTSFANTNIASFGDLTDANGTLYFNYGASAGAKTLYEVVNGSPTQVPLPSGGGATAVGPIAAVGSTVFFAADDSSGTNTLFSSDGSSVEAVTGDPGTNPNFMTDVDGTLFYSSSDPATGYELHTATPGGGGGGGGGGTTPSLDVTTSDKNIPEGSKQLITFNAALDGATAVKYGWDFTNSGKYKALGSGKTGVATHEFATLTPGSYTINAAAKTATGKIYTGSVRIFVDDVAPSVKVTGRALIPFASLGPHFFNFEYKATWTAPAPSKSFTVTWTATPVAGGTPQEQTENVTGRHATFNLNFPGAGIYTIAAEVSDGFGGTGSDTEPVTVVS